ncbi:MAG: hypothetical protein IKV03_06130 [Alphaproteobacteria bacterium]|nr:hypothetical protein [Alphaproteobacteria bacterium]
MKKLILFLAFFFISCSVFALTDNVLDNHAKKLPTSQTTSKEQVVAQLTNGLTNDTDKARVLAAWVAYQVDKNGYEYEKLVKASNHNTLADPALKNDVFSTRIGTSFDFAKLYAELATIAGLKVVIIDGYAGENIPSSRYSGRLMQALEPSVNRIRGGTYRLQRYEGAWNAVNINGNWQLVDTYWMSKTNKMIGRDLTERQMTKEMEKRKRKLPSASQLVANKRIDNEYFFAKPRNFVKTHFPFESKWQLLPVPTTWSSFTK